MTDYLTSLVERARGTVAALRPIPSLYRSAEVESVHELAGEVAARPEAAPALLERVGAPPVPAPLRSAPPVPGHETPSPRLSSRSQPKHPSRERRTATSPQGWEETALDPEPIPDAPSVNTADVPKMEAPRRSAEQWANTDYQDPEILDEVTTETPGNPATAPASHRAVARASLPRSSPDGTEAVAGPEPRSLDNLAEQVWHPTAAPPLDETILADAQPFFTPGARVQRPLAGPMQPGVLGPQARRAAVSYEVAPAVAAAVAERHVTVTIGRLEVRVAAPVVATAPKTSGPRATSLEEYLRARGGRA